MSLLLAVNKSLQIDILISANFAFKKQINKKFVYLLISLNVMKILVKSLLQSNKKKCLKAF